MPGAETAVAVFNDHITAEDAVRKLTHAGFDMNTLTIVGKGLHIGDNEKGSSPTDDQFMAWRARGAFWGGLWGILLSGAFLTLPPLGPVVVVGQLTAALIAVVESSNIDGGFSAIGGTLARIGIPHDSVIDYEAAIRADGFLVVAHGSADDVARAKAIMASHGPPNVYTHPNSKTWPSVGSTNDAGA